MSTNPMTTPLSQATGAVRDKLIALAVEHEGEMLCPWLDGQTTQ